MNSNTIDLWSRVEHIGKVENFSSDVMLALGSVYGLMMKRSINSLCREAHFTAKDKGWHDEKKETATWLALIHSEVSEALEADRKGDQENFEEELADVCIRIFDLCGLMGIDLEKAIIDKMGYNTTRPRKHGKLY